MAFTQITVAGAYRNASGGPAAGAVVFTPVVAMRNDGIVVASPVTAQIVAGAISVSLAATDDPGTSPTGVTYFVEEQVVGARTRRRYYLAVPSAGGPIDLDSAPVAEDIPDAVTIPIPGPPGADGVDGAAGTNGNTVRSGSGAPAGGLGVNGDWYINTSANTIYGPKTSGAWGSPTSLVGPTGATGSPGSAGSPGAAGADGKSVRNGSGTPSGGLGVDGDFYIDTTADAIYGPKTSGSWGSPTSLVGPAGSGNVDSVNGDTGPAVVLDAADVGAQPADADLTAIAGLSASNDDVIQRKAGAWTNRTIAQLSTDLGLASSYQPLDADLTSISGLDSSTAGALATDGAGWIRKTYAQLKTALGLTASDVGLGSVANAAQVQLGTIDAKGDLLAGTADNTVARVAVGANGRVLAAASGASPGVQWEANPTPPVVTLTDAATIAIDSAAGKVFDVTTTADRTMGIPSNPVDGRVILIRHRASGGARTLTLTTGSTGAFKYGTAPDAPATLTATASGAVDLILAVYDATISRFVVAGVAKGF